MKTSLRQIGQDLKMAYQKALLLIAIIPLFPEYFSPFLVFGAAVFAFQDIRQRGEKIKVSFIGKLLLAYIAYMSIMVFFSEHWQNSLFTLLKWIYFYLVYLILNNILTDTDRYDSLMLYVTGVAGCVGFIACCQYRIGFFTGSNPIKVWGWLDSIVRDIFPTNSTQVEYVLRSCSTFSNPNILSEYLSAVIPFVVYFNFYEQRKELRIFCRVCLFCSFAGILFSFCRGGYLALVVVAIALVVLNIRHRFATVSLYGLLTALLIPDEVVERFLTIIPGFKTSGEIINSSIGEDMNTTADIINNSTADFATNERFSIWMESFHQFLDNPFGLGAGTGNTHAAFYEAGIEADHAHNIVLQILLEGGFIALIIMLLIGAKVIKNGIELMRNNYGYAFWLGFGVLGFATSFIISGMVDYPLLTSKLVCNFMMLLAIVERSNILYPGLGIAVRARIRRQLKTTHRLATNHQK